MAAWVLFERLGSPAYASPIDHQLNFAMNRLDADSRLNTYHLRRRAADLLVLGRIPRAEKMKKIETVLLVHGLQPLQARDVSRRTWLPVTTSGGETRSEGGASWETVLILQKTDHIIYQE